MHSRYRIPLFAPALLVLTFLPALASAQTVSTFATGQNGVRGLAMDATGRLYVSVRGNHQIVRYSPPSTVPTVFANIVGMDPIDMVFDDSGNLYVADYAADLVRKITPGGAVSTFATAASPDALTRDPAGNLYVGEYFTQKVLKITPAGVVSTYATAGVAGARLTALYWDTDGSIYTGDLFGVGDVYRIAPGGSPVTTFSTGLNSVVGITRIPTGDLLVTTYENNTLQTINAAGVHTLYAGSATAGSADGPLLSARFNWPAGILYAPPRVYIADYNNDRVRVIDYQTPAQNSTWGRIKTLYR